MTSATGNKIPRSQAGFTLLEIVFAIGLMAIAGAVVIVNVVSMIDRGKVQSADEILIIAIQEARFTAAADRKITELRFNKNTGSLNISNALGSENSYSLGQDFAKNGRSEINFYLVPPARGLDTQNDPLRTTLESKVVRFAPDRSSSPFVFEIDSGSGTPTRVAVDPFSSLERKATR